MQRQLSLPLVLLGLLGMVSWPVGRAQAAQDPVAAAAREEAAENYRALTARVSNLEEEIRSYQSRMTKLGEEIHRMREEIDRLKNKTENTATLDRITRLQEAIKQVDDARQEDNKKVLAEMARQRQLLEKAASKLAAAATVATAPPPPVDRTETRVDNPDKPEKPVKPATRPPEGGYEYAIKKGNTLSGIITDLRAQGYKVTQKQMEEANPGVNWSKLRVGQKIFIPPPSP